MPCDCNSTSSPFNDDNLVPMVLDTTTGLIRPLMAGEKISSIYLNKPTNPRHAKIAPTKYLQEEYLKLYHRLVNLEKKYCHAECFDCTNCEPQTMPDKHLSSVSQVGNIVTLIMSDGQQFTITLPVVPATPTAPVESPYIENVARVGDNLVVSRSDTTEWTVPLCCDKPSMFWGAEDYASEVSDLSTSISTFTAGYSVPRLDLWEQGLTYVGFAAVNFGSMFLTGPEYDANLTVISGPDTVEFGFDPSTGRGYIGADYTTSAEATVFEIQLSKDAVVLGTLKFTMELTSSEEGISFTRLTFTDWEAA